MISNTNVADPKDGELRRVLGPWSAGALIAGSMIGSGIFIFVSPVAVRLSSPALILGAWIVGAAVASCGALSIAELAAAYPETGGTYVFLRRTYGPLVGFLYSWAEFLIMRPGSFGIMAVSFGMFSVQFLGLSPDMPWIQKALAVSAVAVLTGINIAGVRAGGTVQNVLTAIKLGCLLGVIGVGVAFAAGALESHPVQIEPVKYTEGSSLFWLFGVAMISVMWTFGGWDESPFVAEEIRHPERNLPLSILAGLWTVALLFVLVNAAYLAILSPAEIAGSGMQTAKLAMQRPLGEGAGRVFALGLMICTFGAANGLALTGGRIAYAAGRTQPLFRWFAHTHPKTKTPVRSLVTQGVLTTAAILILESPMQLLFYTALAYWLFAGLMAAAVIVLRRRDPQRERPFRVWGYPVVPMLFVAAAIGMAVSVVSEDVASMVSKDESDDTYHALATVVILAVGAALFVVQTVVFRGPRGGDDAQSSHLAGAR